MQMLRKPLSLVVVLSVMAIDFSLLSVVKAANITMGETTGLTNSDSQNANILLAQQATLSQTATLQSLSFYVTVASGNLRLGVFDATGAGGKPGNKLAETNSFVPTTGWNTANVITPVSLSPGTYYLAYLPSAGGLSFVNGTGPTSYYYSYTFGAMPTTFSATPTSTSSHWSFYATLTTGAPDTTAPTVSVTAPSSGSTVSGSTTVSANASDDSAVAGVQFKLDGNNLGSEDTSFPYSISWDTATASNGSHSLTAVARDTSNNTKTSSSVTVTVSNVVAPPPPPPPPSPTPPPPPPGIMNFPSDRDASANWRMAGLLSQGGIPSRTTQCGATINPRGSGLDDTANIQAAINACPAGQVVQLAAGTFTISEGNTISLNKTVTLRGAGAGTTKLVRTNGAKLDSYVPGSNPGPLVSLGGGGSGAAVNLAADGQEESYSVQVSSTAGLQVGQIVLIDETSGAGWQPERISAWVAAGYPQIWAAPDYRVVWTKHNPNYQYVDDLGANEYPYNANSAGCWFSNCDRPTNEMHQISSISGNIVTFDSPLMISYRVSHQAKLYPYTNMVQKAGVENLTVSGGDDGNVVFNSCAYCWAQNVENTLWLGHGFNIVSSFRVQLEGIYVHNAVWPVNGGGGYAIAFEWGSSEGLIENSISMLANKVIVANSAGAGSVVAYNYMDDAYINGQTGWTEVGLNASHMVGPHHVLFEGNYSFNFDSDETHGNSIYMTVFRNYLSGFRKPFTALDGSNVNDMAGTSGPLRTIGAHPYSYWFTFIGNVLGTAGQMSGWTYDCVNPTNDISTKCIYNLGGMDIVPQGSDPYVASTAIRDGNYDFLTNSQKWTNGSYIVPNSLYLTTKPSFFGTCTWPWVDPATGALSTLPAKARFDAGTPNIITACGGGIPTNTLPSGSFDGLKADGTTLYGWSYDPDSSSSSVNVQIYVNGPAGTGTQIFSGQTTVVRTDVNSTFGISGNHGFEVSIPAQYRDGAAHSYYVYGIDINDSTKSFLLTWSPKSFTVSSGTAVVGDINLDHIVNSIDYSLLNAKWFTNDATCDLNHDGLVNAIDFSILNSNWFKTW